MKSLFIKELNHFFSSITGYLVMAVFLVLTSLFLFVLPGMFNIFDSGYAGVDNLFLLAPWVFLFLVPALTMRMFSDEKRTGTLELLLTKPLSDFELIFAKFLAGFTLVLLALLPTLIFVYTVYSLGNPVGNLDSGATIGSFVGLLLLGGGYVAIGIFSSSLTDNPIVSFIVAVLLSLFVYVGFEQIAELKLFGVADLIILNLGINEHYTSLSRGVIDSRDIVYYISLMALFFATTQLVIKSRKW